MKLTHYLKLLISISAFFIGGCSGQDNEMACPEGRDVTIHASLGEFTAGIGTRTEVGGVQEDGSIVMNWSAKESMGVFSTNEANVKFVSTNTTPSAAVEFKPETATGISGTPEFGYYPYSPDNNDRKAIKLTIPETQEYTDVTSIAKYDAKAATITQGADKVFYMQMHQLACLMKFEINVGDVRKVVETIGDQTDLSKIGINTQHIQRVNIRTNDMVDLTGSYTYDLTNLSQGMKPVANTETVGDLTVQLPGKPLLTSANQLVFYAIVAPGNHLNKKLTCEISTEKIALQFTTTIQCDFKAGSYYTIPVNSTVINHADKGSTSVVTTPDLPEPTDPTRPGPEEETANCYMINTTGSHEFWGTQIGNGAKGIIKGQGFHTEDPYINPKSAGLLWQDEQGFISDVSFNPKDGKVHYTANKTTGNAMIAVYDGENGTGNILWSWHIWGTGDMPRTETYTNMAGHRFEVMDRALGAHSKTAATATLYQWGRKDPIPNSRTYYKTGGNGAAAVNIEDSYPVLSNESFYTIKESIQHPDKILCVTQPSSTMLQPSYLKEPNYLLWGDGNKTNYPDLRPEELKNTKADNRWLYRKTIYDPSPAGYRVANKFTFTGFLDDGCTEGNNSRYSGDTRVKHINYVEPLPDGTRENSAWHFKMYPEDKTGTCWQMTGRRDVSTGTLLEPTSRGKGPCSVGYNAWIWTSGRGANPGDASSLHISSCTKDKNSNKMYWSIVRTVDQQYQIFVHGVRCVKDDPQLVVNK